MDRFNLSNLVIKNLTNKIAISIYIIDNVCIS